MSGLETIKIYQNAKFCRDYRKSLHLGHNSIFDKNLNFQYPNFKPLCHEPFNHLGTQNGGFIISWQWTKVIKKNYRYNDWNKGFRTQNKLLQIDGGAAYAKLNVRGVNVCHYFCQIGNYSMIFFWVNYFGVSQNVSKSFVGIVGT